jgi:hypothetical protein
LLTHRELTKRIRQYLNYGVRSGMLMKYSNGRYDLHNGFEKPFIHSSIGVMDYTSNELASLAHLWPGAAERLKA